MFPDCWLQPFLTCPWLSHGTNISNNSAKVAKGRGIYWWVMYLHGDVVQYKNIFCKKTKNRNCSSISLLYQCMSNAMCYYTRRSSLTWLVLHTEEKICSVMWCPVQYSQHPTSIIVLRSICLMLKPFCNIDMTYSTKIFHVLSLRLHLYDTCSLQPSLLRDRERDRELGLMERLRRWKAD